MLKYAMEILLSESSVITAYYFHWGTSSVAIFLALLGLTVLPVNVVVGNYISNMFEDRSVPLIDCISSLLFSLTRDIMYIFSLLASLLICRKICLKTRRKVSC